ncbi:hypothetical protein [Stieleria sp.]|uniref:hypothetical protein n=1 Tax=Stieleria sp. TaxID=2795976 RepID=UPI003566A18C
MALNRSAALEYAAKYWNKPCSDGYFMLSDKAVRISQKRKELKAPESDGWEARFVPEFSSDGHMVGESAVFQKPNGDEILIHGWDGLADCAHYICQCLKTGNVSVHEMSVPKLVKKLRAQSDVKTLGMKLSRTAAQQIIDLGVFKGGDVIAYFNIDPQGDYGGKADYTHSTLFLGTDSSGVGRIACHTICRHQHLPKNEEWWLKDGRYAYTLIHFTAGDRVANDADHFQGWWKIEYFGRTEYYRFDTSGRVRWTSKVPKAASDRIESGAKNLGHWFRETRQLLIAWQSTGTAERWAAVGKQNKYDIKVNQHKGTATKLFT